jgi:hypothetical protein
MYITVQGKMNVSYEGEMVGLHLWMFTSRSKTDVSILNKLDILISWDQEENTGK